MQSLEEKIVLVSSNNGNLGIELSYDLIRQGARTILFCDGDDNQSLNESAYSIRKNLLLIKSNCFDYTIISKELADKYGYVNNIDFMINVIDISECEYLKKSDSKKYNDLLQRYIDRLFDSTKLFLNKHSNNNMGSIINIVFNNNGDEDFYNLLKHGVGGFTKTISKELANKKIRANAITAKLISENDRFFCRNDLLSHYRHTDNKRILTFKDVFNLALFLIGQKSSYITGQIFSL